MINNMRGFISSLSPLFSKYKIEVFLLSMALFIFVFSVLFFFLSIERIPNEEPISQEQIFTSIPQEKYFVDLEGSVERPDVYEITSGARLKDVLIASGGLSVDADRIYFARNFNLARLLKDQEKIYIPSISETENNVLAATQTIQSQTNSSLAQPANTININTGSMDELDSLAGIGAITAQKIIQNRPFQTIQELLDKKIVNKGVFENIKNRIAI
ncbi:hypothetical protein A2866_02335 [Candidatus Roizmanbacteria bacterium RIFCSPHIGHO2_01_FULL_39_8]|uniref:Soluble ligand binding domain-containing protein n=2 Tax=Candidatus Roizmaniibacteriota TaxID=1752723 RepID=A0A1F7GT66_9BACT|nr:MAG: hypothetical protein A2866_02335 [Candidatus Roizmanbacteria bacterium RIFCSPHIGHO2_01_FULL_39_8]OGK37151.1 MAG: hypothetical protein A3F60_04530 [Candidatus Roizmanbacteria bacterium RIFCSPHIGHO2_12_FULL_39_8]